MLTCFLKAARPTALGYPGGRLVHRTYGAAGGPGDALSRLAALNEDSGGDPGDALAEFAYSGAGRLVAETHKSGGSAVAQLDYYGGTWGTYAGWDRFGRVVDQKWHRSGTVLDRHGYGYDAASNRTWRDNALASGQDWKYTYDGLDRLTLAERGTFSTPPTLASTNYKQAFGLDGLGNWATFKWDPTGSAGWTEQARDHNAVNEIDDDDNHANAPGNTITGSGAANWLDPTHDAAGNMTQAPVPGAETARHHYTWDAWNRLAAVYADDDGEPGALVAEYRYDGLGRRTVKLVPAGENWDRTDLYYSAGWQALEERFAAGQGDKEAVATIPKVQWVWSPRYIDAPVLRDRDTDANGTLDERLYYCNDANMNVTALVGTDGAVAERYTYDPYGKATVRHPTTWAEVAWADSKKNEVLFCGYRFDNETGLYHVRRRPYHPTLGRWGSRDPDDYVDGLNGYQFARASPPARLDSTGLSSRGSGQAEQRGGEDATGGDEECEPRCGPGVTDEVIAVYGKLKQKWNSWSIEKQRKACKAIFSSDPLPERAQPGQKPPPTWLMAWDIDKLWRGGNSWINRTPYCPPCAVPQTGEKNCRDTVEVDGKCFYSGSVNYVLWGWINRLCGHRQQLVEAPIKLYKGGIVPGRPKAQNFEPSVEWALTGYYGWPDLDIGTPASDRKHCAVGCPVNYGDGAFQFFWAPHGWN